MKDRNKKNRKIIYRIAIYVILGSVAVFCLTRNVRAKYITEVPFSGNVKIDAGLAQEFQLCEHKAVIDSTSPNVSAGIYTLEGETVQQNTYIGIMPNSKIEKDPFITIKNKTDTKAYLYVEVCEKDFPVDSEGKRKIKYELNDNWKLVEDAVGSHGGKVYVFQYSVDDEPTQLDSKLYDSINETEGEIEKEIDVKTIKIYILKDNEITADSTINNSDAVKEFQLNFYGYLVQIPDSMLAAPYGPDPYSVYSTLSGTS